MTIQNKKRISQAHTNICMFCHGERYLYVLSWWKIASEWYILFMKVGQHAVATWWVFKLCIKKRNNATCARAVSLFSVVGLLRSLDRPPTLLASDTLQRLLLLLLLVLFILLWAALLLLWLLQPCCFNAKMQLHYTDYPTPPYVSQHVQKSVYCVTGFYVKDK